MIVRALKQADVALTKPRPKPALYSSQYPSQTRQFYYTLKTSMLVEDGDSILKFFRRVSHSEIIYFSSQEQIAYFLTQDAVHLLVHFKFLRAPPRSF